MSKNYRIGCVGALLDEYEKAINELKSVIETIDNNDFSRKINSDNSDMGLESYQAIIEHVVQSGYVYMNYVREVLGEKIEPLNFDCSSPKKGVKELDAIFNYTEEGLRNYLHLTPSELKSIEIITRLKAHYTLEVLLERAIVHILRHRRQIEKLKSITENKN